MDTIRLDDPYHLIDALYDAEHQGFDDDIELYLAMADQVGGPVLELGCGSGRVLAPLAEAGTRVVGVDVSGPMLRRAQTRLGSNLEQSGIVSLENIDMREAASASGGPFAMALYSLNGLMHLETQEDQMRSLRSVAEALDDDGTVVIDLINPTPDYLERIADATTLEWTGQTEDHARVQKWAHREIDFHGQSIDTEIWYDLTSSTGDLSRIHTGFTLRYVHLSELTLMLQSAGFGSPSFFGSYQLDPLEGTSERMIVTAEKLS